MMSPPETNSLIAIFTASFLGSLHCVGMCGPLVSVYSFGSCQPSLGVGKPGLWDWGSHILYNGARLISYLALGASFGTLGGVLDRSGGLGGAHQVSTLVGGIVIVLFGVFLLAEAYGLAWFTKAYSKLERALELGRIFAFLPKLVGKPGPATALVIGLLTGFLPCGWLYMFVAAALSSGSAIGGVMVMFAFWLGTVPAMLGVGLIIGRLGANLRSYIPKVSALLMILVGLIALSGRLQMSEKSLQMGTKGPACHSQR